MNRRLIDAKAVDAALEADPYLQGALALNRSGWVELKRNDQLQHDWRLLDAYIAKTDAMEEPSSIIYAERMALCRRRAMKLATAHGADNLKYLEAFRVLRRFDLLNQSNQIVIDEDVPF